MKPHHPDPAIAAANDRRDKRIEAGMAELEKIWSFDLPRPSTITPDEVDQLREVIRVAFGHREVRGRIRTVQLGEWKPYYNGTHVRFTAEQVAVLFRLAGWPLIEAADHGDCNTCEFGPDRIYNPPCVGCGVHHPSHTSPSEKV